MLSRRSADDDVLLAQLSAVDVLALTAEGEARGEAVEGRIAVMNVVRNRVELNREAWGGSDYDRVCFAPEQFDCWDPIFGGDNYRFLMALAGKIVGKTLVPQNFPVLRECRFLAEGILAGDLQDNVRGATFYYAPLHCPVPQWAAGKDPVAHIGRHVFFAGIV